jgi:1-acyl-sn-glycerol-3-phosphate acyltransferase
LPHSPAPAKPRVTDMSIPPEYRPSRRKPIRRVLRFLMDRIAFRFLAKIDSIEGAENVPPRGLGIVYFNHTSFADSVAVLYALPRDVVPVARFDFTNVPFWGVFPLLWGTIPIRRGEADRSALKKAISVLQAGELLLLAPEGTRRQAMGPAKDGMAFLAARTGAPLIPVAVTGMEGFPSVSPRRWAMPGARIRIGRPFSFRRSSGRIPRERLRKMTEDAMYRLAELLPPERRGVYADRNRAEAETIEPDSR